MALVNLERRAWIGEAAGAVLRDMRGLWVDAASGTAVTVSAQTVVSWRLFEGANAALLSSASYSAALTPTLANDLYALPPDPDDDTGPRLILGDDGGGLWGYSLRASGSFTPQISVAAPQTGRLELQALTAGPNGAVYSAGVDGAGITVMTTRPDGSLGFVDFARDTDDIMAARVTALATSRVAGNDFLVAGSSGDAGISAWRIDPASGRLTHTDSLGSDRGLGILPAITDMETVTIDGQTLVVVASSSVTGGMGALSVLSLSAGGGLTATDHVIDTRDTRFGQVQSLSVAQANGLTYVAAGGGDDGVSVFVLLPGGRLMHLASLEYQLDNGLHNVSDIALVPLGAEMQVLVTAQGEGGLTQLVFDLPEPGISRLAGELGGTLTGTSGADALSGRGGDDVISGGNGDDILFDGGGGDTLTGGSGSDIFALAGDGVTDRITDFNRYFDWLDLSGLPMLYDPSQLQIAASASGATITWRGERLELVSATGGPMHPDIVLTRILTMPDRPPLVVPRRFAGTETAERHSGHEGQDEIMGEDGNDTLEGLAGDDTIRGGNGYDSLHGGPGNDLIAGGNGRDRVRLGMGNDRFEDVAQNDIHGADTVLADAGDDTVLGWGGADMIFGHAGFDLLAGGLGADRIYGGDGFDTIRGGDGDDLTVGGNGRDLAFLGNGNDIFHDNAQGGEIGSDTVWAGAGDDTVQGGNGDDVAHGEGGADLLIGRLGKDSLYGGGQDDTLSGGEGDDVIYGGMGRDRAWLGPGNDLYGDHAQSDPFGADMVWGGAGNDTIDAGGGDDTLRGEGGADVFIFSVGPGARVIPDFQPGLDEIRIANQQSAFIRQNEDGLTIDWQTGQVLLEGISFADLQQGDLLFI